MCLANRANGLGRKALPAAAPDNKMFQASRRWLGDQEDPIKMPYIERRTTKMILAVLGWHGQTYILGLSRCGRKCARDCAGPTAVVHNTT